MKRLTLLVAVCLLSAFTVQIPSATATYAGANGRIAFNRAGDIYTVTAAGTGLKRLTSYGGGASTPKWSPNGRQIAYVYNGSIYTMNADGTNKLRRFTGWAPSWSPDGTRLAFATTRVTTDEAGDPCPYNALVIQAFTAANPTEIERFDAKFCTDSYSEEEFGPTTAWAGDRVYYSAENYYIPPGWNADRITSGIAYARTDGTDIDGGVLVYYSGSGTTRAPDDAPPPTVDSAPTAPNIVFTSPNTDRQVDPGRNYFPTVRSVDGTAYSRRITVDAYSTFPTYSPDGKQILYTYHKPGGGYSIRRVTLPGGPTATPTTLISPGSQADWQPVP